jgi:hypothetical protein
MKIKIAVMALFVMMSACNDAPNAKDKGFPKDIVLLDSFELNSGGVQIERFIDRTNNVVCYVRSTNSSMSCVPIEPADPYVTK